FVWLMILISHLAYRKHLNSEDVAHANFTVPLWPLGQYFAIAMILLTFGTMFWMSDFHSALIAGVVFTVAMSIRYYFIDRKNKAEAAAASSLPPPGRAKSPPLGRACLVEYCSAGRRRTE